MSKESVQAGRCFTDAPVRRQRKAAIGPGWRAVRAAMADFARSRDGGAMLVGGAFLILMMAFVGERMTNYAWDEAQREEIRAVIRAAVAAAGPLLSEPAANDALIRERVAEFATAALDGLTVAAEDVAVSYDADADITTVDVDGAYEFDRIWRSGKGPEGVDDTVRVRLENERYEVAMALDVSGSMRQSIGGVSKLDALKAVIENVGDTMDAATRTTPGSLLVSIVPFGLAVNAADTCNPDPNTGLCRSARSAGKERYLRMLAGAGGDLNDSLADARAARDRDQGGHWVDAFHHYGAGTDLGSLRRRFLPADLLDDRDWDLRRENIDIDVSGQVPGLGNWTVRDADFWNGCLMARWGAYWDPRARPVGWRQDDAGNWPVTKAVSGWSPMGAQLPADTPLHLSDEPPDADDPHSLFTAYSWPDARISGRADHLLQGAMLEMLHPDAQASRNTAVVDWLTSADNDWSLAAHRGGSTLCPESPVMPLTDDLPTLRRAVARLAIIEPHLHPSGNGRVAGTYLNVGMAWALRTLSPLWRGVWGVRDGRGLDRPGVSCAPGDSATECDVSLVKSILIVSDGANAPGEFIRTRLARRPDPQLNAAWSDRLCNPGRARRHPDYHAAAALDAPATFNARFRQPNADDDWVDTAGRLNDGGRERFADALLAMAGASGDSDRRTALLSTLGAPVSAGVPATPWQLFRGRDADVVDALVAADSGFELGGRPTLIDNRCRLSSVFGPYGRLDDLVYVGDVGADALSPPVPATDVAPFEVASVPDSVGRGGSPWSGSMTNLRNHMRSRIDDWFVQACRIAGLRGVRVNAIFIGQQSRRNEISVLERCVDVAGGNPRRADVFVTPEPAALSAAFEEIFTIRRNLRFFN